MCFLSCSLYSLRLYFAFFLLPNTYDNTRHHHIITSSCRKSIVPSQVTRSRAGAAQIPYTKRRSRREPSGYRVTSSRGTQGRECLISWLRTGCGLHTLSCCQHHWYSSHYPSASGQQGSRTCKSQNSTHHIVCSSYPPQSNWIEGLTVIAPVAPIVKYETVRYNLTPVVDGPFVGYGVDVDKAWDSIANDSRLPSLPVLSGAPRG